MASVTVDITTGAKTSDEPCACCPCCRHSGSSQICNDGDCIQLGTSGTWTSTCCGCLEINCNAQGGGEFSGLFQGTFGGAPFDVYPGGPSAYFSICNGVAYAYSCPCATGCPTGTLYGWIQGGIEEDGTWKFSLYNADGATACVGGLTCGGACDYSTYGTDPIPDGGICSGMAPGSLAGKLHAKTCSGLLDAP